MSKLFYRSEPEDNKTSHSQDIAMVSKSIDEFFANGGRVQKCPTYIRADGFGSKTYRDMTAASSKNKK